MYLSEVDYASYLVYPTRGTTEICGRAKDIALAVKNDTRSAPGGASMVDYVVGKIRDGLMANGHDRFLGPDRTLVPVPRSSLLTSGAHWPALRICQALHVAGLGSSILQCLVRERPVKAASRSAPGDRPTVKEHLETMAVRGTLGHLERITLVDDVITQGRQLLAAAALLRDALTAVDIKAFAVTRTLGYVTEIDAIAKPCIGVIRPTAFGETSRVP